VKPYLLSLGAGLLVGILYNLLGVRSPAPPVIALVGLFGMLVGEQLVPLSKSWFAPQTKASGVQTSCADHVFGRLPSNTDAAKRSG
jgi:XapX domain-containing protein